MTSRQAIPASFEEARRLQFEGRLAEAASIFRSILEAEPGHVDALLCLGAIAPHDEAGRHLLRCSVSDLFRDTLPVGAFTTASDALWTGLPVLTCAGPTPAGRGAGSLLAAFGLPELIAGSLADYEARAVHLATHRRELAAIRREIAARRTTSPVFDTPRLVRDLEEIYLRLAGR